MYLPSQRDLAPSRLGPRRWQVLAVLFGDLALERRGNGPGIAEFVDQPLGDARADEMGDVAAELADLLDEARGDELVAVARHQEDGLDLGVEPRVHPGHLELVLEIRYRAPTDMAKCIRRLSKARTSMRSCAPLSSSASSRRTIATRSSVEKIGPLPAL